MNGEVAADKIKTRQTTANGRGTGRVWFAAILTGLVLGVILTAVAVVYAMPRLMIVTTESHLGFDETVQAIETAVLEHGWSTPGTTDMNKSMAAHGVSFDPRVKTVKLCNAEYAKGVLTGDRYLSCMMPCSISVWESDDGKVYVSKMNTGLMGKMFGGAVAEIMGGKVAADEHAILESALGESR